MKDGALQTTVICFSLKKVYWTGCMLLLWQKNIADGQKLSFVAVTVQLLYSFNSTHSPIPKLTGNLKKKERDYAYSIDFL